MIKNLLDYLSIINRKRKYKKISYSLNGVDLLVDYVFKNKKHGIYLDVGAQHPISNNNTYLLYKRGWSGINIDLDKDNINLFNISRPNDLNLNNAISSKESIKELYFYHAKSPINTIEKKVSEYQSADVKEIKKIDTTTLNNIINKNRFNKIDYMNIDVEGHELEVLKGFDLDFFKPDVISVEYLDLKMNNLEFKNNNLNSLINSDLYKYLLNKNYIFVNWIHGDVIFVNKSFRN